MSVEDKLEDKLEDKFKDYYYHNVVPLFKYYVNDLHKHDFLESTTKLYVLMKDNKISYIEWKKSLEDDGLDSEELYQSLYNILDNIPLYLEEITRDSMKVLLKRQNKLIKFITSLY